MKSLMLFISLTLALPPCYAETSEMSLSDDVIAELEVATGSAIVASVPFTFRSAQPLAKQINQLMKLLRAQPKLQPTLRNEIILKLSQTALRAALPFAMVAIGVAIAANGLVYLVSQDRLAVIGTHNDPNLL